ncbi:MAG: gephyrin-like molybdotransferase Glp [Hyphomicrobiaceae bacterium]|nr:molybdopterin molybdotransferase MoeA [Hyphomicrobiaceae bacterium]
MADKTKTALTVEEALVRVLGDVIPLSDFENVGLMTARGRVLAAPVTARHTQPPFNASAMDGYAVRACDVAALPATLTVVGEAAAGRAFGGGVDVGQAARIFTGAPVPAGADAIVIQENVARVGPQITVVSGAVDPEHVRPLGGDFRLGALLVAPEQKLTARALLLAAAGGYGTVVVRRRPRVALIATGDELVLPGTMPAQSQIVCSNPYGVGAMLEAFGAEVTFVGIAKDTRESLAALLDQAHGADVVITLGGASVGDHDLVGPVLQDRGMALDFWKIAMRPGKPLMFGRLGAQRILGLPGNPVSSMITARLFAVPLVLALLGIPESAQPWQQAVTAVALTANGARAHYMRATAVGSPHGGLVVTPVDNQDSSLITPLATANVLIVRPIGAPVVVKGALVPVMALDF